MRLRCRRAALLAVALLACRAQGVVITRGPYLQTGTPTSVVVCWRTDLPADSRVRFGTAPDTLTASASDSAAVRNHALTLSGLLPSTTYWYSIGTSGSPLDGGVARSFTTAPPSGVASPFRFWVIGDSGTADANARTVRDAFETFSAGRPAAFWLMLGDDAYLSGTDVEMQRAVFETYPALLARSVLWSAFGNHDSYSANASSGTGPYFDAFVFPRAGEAGGVPSGTEAYYSFDFGNAHFVSLDSTSSSRRPGSPMLTWLAADLASSDRAFLVAFFHHPPYTKGSHDSDSETELVEMRQNVVPILEAAGIDLVLAGHSHSYERSFLIDGHTGPSGTFTSAIKKNAGDGRLSGSGPYVKPPGRASHAGAVYAVVGSSGLLAGGPLNHPAMAVSQNVLGSLVVDVRGNRLDAYFVGATGALLDSFTIVKGALRRAAPGAAGGSQPRRRTPGSAGRFE